MFLDALLYHILQQRIELIGLCAASVRLEIVWGSRLPRIKAATDGKDMDFQIPQSVGAVLQIEQGAYPWLIDCYGG